MLSCSDIGWRCRLKLYAFILGFARVEVRHLEWQTHPFVKAMEAMGIEKEMYRHEKTYLAVATLLPAVMEAHAASPETDRMQLFRRVLRDHGIMDCSSSRSVLSRFGFKSAEKLVQEMKTLVQECSLSAEKLRTLLPLPIHGEDSIVKARRTIYKHWHDASTCTDKAVACRDLGESLEQLLIMRWQHARLSVSYTHLTLPTKRIV